MTDFLVNPAIQSGALPFGIALCMAAVLGFSGTASARYAGLAVIGGFLAAYVVTFGWPPLLPQASGQKIPHIGALAAVAGVIAGLIGSQRRASALGLAVVVVGTLWIGWSKVMAAPSLDHLSTALVVVGGALALYSARTGSAPPGGEGGIEQAVPLLVIALAMAVISFMGASASIAQNAGALAAALGGVMVLNWPKRRFGLDATDRLVPVAILAALSAQIAFFTQAPAWVLLLLLPALYADRLVARWMPESRPAAWALRPMVIALIALVPAVVAIGAAQIVLSSSDLSGGY